MRVCRQPSPLAILSEKIVVDDQRNACDEYRRAREVAGASE
ncbi:hypothetical protein P4S93_13230 [Aneurinibacillus thermoaerophilus]|nr:hypothetical protein [Aneurinibacillus thermoaerophilus]MED0674333.1 hypothetical protein [Aneurinibacillus thermoaerophilus]MED0756968.1 hypothetical protein [Aneurinibacillus thermoaerophilus]MED0761727.1 hypothetical protein [Aneurinibacillus thermoaerophilus]